MGLRVYTGGTFDLFHSGHANFLAQCAKLGKVTVALNSDDFIAEYKGKPPVMNQAERAAVLLACRYVDEVVIHTTGVDSKPTISYVDPDIIVVGSDWARRDYYKQMSFDQDWLDEQNIWLCYIPYTNGISSTEIKKRLSGSLK